MSRKRSAMKQASRHRLWTPTREQVESSPMAQFARRIEQRHDQRFQDYFSLHRWTIENLAEFWQEVWNFFDVLASRQPATSLDQNKMPSASWFPGAQLNFAQNILRHASQRPEALAIIGEHESSPTSSLTWSELSEQVASVAAWLRKVGARPGDRVVGVLPNIPQTVVAMLATASVGGVWSVVGTDFGTKGLADRLAQLEPKVLVTVDGYEFGGRVRDVVSRGEELLDALPTVETLMIVDRSEGQFTIPDHLARFSEIVSTPAAHDFEQVEFEHPLWVLFSSGTTGKPKGIVQSQGGILLEFCKVLGLQVGLTHQDVAYFAVATTWMVWNLHVGNLLLGSTIVTYDGSPTHGGTGKSFEILQTHRATFFGTGASLLTMAEHADLTPKHQYDLTALRALLVTASPLPASTWDWVYESVSDDVRLTSDSGGTDICSAFIGGNPFDSVYRGEIMGPYLGVNAQAWNSDGQAVVDEVGELMVTTPGPSMPLYFWNDPEGKNLHEAYFDHYPGVWRHGDWVTNLATGGYVIHGRSDSTINRGGIRLGSADLTHVVDEVEGVSASMVLGAELDDGDYYMPLFIELQDGAGFTEDLQQRIVAAIRGKVSPRYVPDAIIPAPSLPRTRTGKLLEVPIKRLYQGAHISSTNRESAAEPETLDWFVEHARQFRTARGRT